MNLTVFCLTFQAFVVFCTAAVERQEPHEDNRFTLNSEILQCTRRQNM